jgi:hypothetical protein
MDGYYWRQPVLYMSCCGCIRNKTKSGREKDRDDALAMLKMLKLRMAIGVA